MPVTYPNADSATVTNAATDDVVSVSTTPGGGLTLCISTDAQTAVIDLHARDAQTLSGQIDRLLYRLQHPARGL
jgi:hypothetical protein